MEAFGVLSTEPMIGRVLGLLLRSTTDDHV